MQPATESVLLNRLLDAHRRRRRVVFLVGAGLSLPPSAVAPGVPGAAELVRRVTQRLQESGAALGAGDGSSGFLAYQEALEFYRQHRGQRGLDELVREAVLEACPGGDPVDLAAARGGDLEACLRLERTAKAWALPPGVEALGRLIARFPETFGQAVFTTNFDPLVEVAIGRAGGQSHTTFLAEDGRFSARHGDGCHVIHVHGFWSGIGFTAHTVAQLSRPRPQLRRDLERFLERSDLVVLAYGGWQDVFSEVITSILIDPAQRTEVLWCFYEKDWPDIEARYPTTLERLAPGFGDVVVSYSGIDANIFLGRLEDMVSSQEAHPLKTTDVSFEPFRTAVLTRECPPPPRQSSPFIVGSPIYDDASFFGRDRHKVQIGQALARCQPVQVLGERRMGKTSLLLWVRRHAPTLRPEWPVAWVDAGALAVRSPGALVQAIRESLESGGERGEEAFADEATAGEAFERLLPMVLLVDEASALAAPGHRFDAAFLGLLRAAGQRQRLAWVSTSHADLHGLFQEDHLTSPFLNDSLTLTVGVLEEAGASALLRQGLDEGQASFAVEAAGTLPFPLQWVASALFEGRTAEKARDEMRAALELNFDGWWRWRNGQAEEQRLLGVCVEGVALAGLDPADRRRLRRLAERGLVREHEGRFTLPGSAWRDYVAERRHG